MAHRHVVMASAWLEIIVGGAFIAAPGVLCVLLFDVKPEGIAEPLALARGWPLGPRNLLSAFTGLGIAPQCGGRPFCL